ncbi:MAG: hypothetical protein M3N39_02075 [Pseudomonadota bacterium]|nr:hypothetical protein [Pseudomonadota bacterium]
MLATLALLIIPDGAAEARPREARCLVKAAGAPDYRGPCRFSPEKRGSFTIVPGGRRAFGNGITSISAWMVSPGVAEVRGLTREGVNSRWGEARRSRRDRACWLGSDFSICVY